ncbi:MAG: (d)CMP kinase [Solirubrobacteraceae bacterium]|nr:(d)CMP kinase [Solirubrobacteraceae bacterium]
MAIEISALAEQIRALRPSAGGVRVIAIDGPAGSGKSSLATELAEVLGEALVLNTDQLYPGWDGLAEGAQRLVDDVLLPLSAGLAATVRPWDWSSGSEGAPRELPACATLIVDGAGCGSRAAAPFLSMIIWLDAEPELRQQRALERDGEIFAPHWESWAEQERALFEREQTRQRADLIILTDDDPPQSA